MEKAIFAQRMKRGLVEMWANNPSPVLFHVNYSKKRGFYGSFSKIIELYKRLRAEELAENNGMMLLDCSNPFPLY